MPRLTPPTAVLAMFGLMLVCPAFAQPAGVPMQDGTITEMQRAVPESGMTAVPRQNQSGAAADAIDDGMAGTRPWLKQAQDALRLGRLGDANEFLERAETRMLSRSTLASRAGVPMADPRLLYISASRAAVQRRDRAEALRQIGLALGEG